MSSYSEPHIPAPPYSQMGRSDLILYCERLRNALKEFDPLTLAMNASLEEAQAAEEKRVRALNSHSERA